MIFSIVSATEIYCPKYTNLNGTAKENEKCGLIDVGVLEYRKCEEGFVCQPLHFGIESVCLKDTGKRVAGENCTKNDECESGSCSDKVCKGFEADKNCNSTAQCAQELYCNVTCKKPGDKCGNFAKCASNQFCYIPQEEDPDRDNGTCYTYASKDKGDNVPAAAACKSYYTNENGTCIDGPTLTSKDDKTKYPDDGLCHYKYNGIEIKTPRTCGRGKEGKAYCPLGVGDLDLEPVMFGLISSL